MKLSGVLSGALRPTLLLLSFLSMAHAGMAQAKPSGGGAYLDSSTDWDVFLGASYARAFSNSYSGNIAGWDASVSNYPYEALPWLGGVIDTSGFYATSKAGVGTQFYSMMGGPSVAVRSSRIQPFVRFMVGGVVQSTSATGSGATTVWEPYRAGAVGANATAAATTATTANRQSFLGMDAGGGVDYPITSRCALRVQADWTPFWVNAQRQDAIRAFAGLDFRF